MIKKLHNKFQPQNKSPRTNQNPQIKTPRIEGQNQLLIQNVLDHSPVWQFKVIDLEHQQLGWKSFKIDHLDEVLRKLSNYETMSWNEIINSARDHFVTKDNLSRDAKRRLKELQLDEAEGLFRLRLTGKQRVWGILEGYVFRILWWDADHTVCPSQKKHT